MSNRALALFTALLIATASCSCGGEAVTETDSQPVSDTDTTVTTDETRFTADVPDKTFDGYEFRFLARSEKIGKWWHRDIYAETESGETLNDAVYARNMAVSEALGITISPFWVDSQNAATVASASILAGDDDFDAILAPANNLNSLARNKQTLDLFTIPYLDLTKPWWDQNSVKDLSVRNKLFYVYGDFTVMDDEVTSTSRSITT